MNEYGTMSPTAKTPKEKCHLSACLPVCFSSSTHPFDVLDDDDDDYVRAPRSPMMPEIRDRCRNMFSRIGGRRRRRASSADFSYDPSSYALNFEDDTTRADDNLLRWMLPPSTSGSLTPPVKSTTSRDIMDDVLGEDGVNRTWRPSPPENKEKFSKCGNIVMRIGRRGRNRHSSTSADFSYEPSTYSLNFEDDSSKADEIGPFMERLPHSPSPLVENSTSLRPQIAAFS